MHPRLNPSNIERIQLLERLKKARHKTCLLIHGPAGSGKTSIAFQWRSMALTLGWDVAWLTVRPQDGRQDVLGDLFDALDAVDSNLTREGRILYNRRGTSNLDAIALALLRAQVLRNSPLTLILDDWQYASNANANAVLQTLLDCAPEHIQIVIISRSVPNIAFARLRDQNELEEIGPSDLRFSLKEVQQFIQSGRNDIEAIDARKLFEMTDGWAAGLRLVSLQPLTPSVPVQNTENFTDYFNREVLCHLDADEIIAMCRLAAASGFNASLAAVLMGKDKGPKLVQRLHDENLFVTPQRDNANDFWYVFHPLFKEILLEHFKELKIEDQYHTHQILAGWFGEKRQLWDAVYHAVAAEDYDQAVLWVDRWARELFLNGELYQLARSVSKLPIKSLHKHNSLLLWKGWAQLCYQEFSACHETLNILLPKLKNTSDIDKNESAYWLLLSFSLCLQEEDIEAALAMLPDMLNLQHGSDPVLIGGRRNLLGWLYAKTGQYELAREMLQGYAPLLEDGKPLLGSAFGYIMMQSLYGLSWLFEGNVRKTEEVLREALSQSEASLGRYDESTCNAAGYLSTVLYEMNELEALHRLLEGRFDTILRVSLPDAIVTVALAFARLHCAEGNYLEALEGLERLQEIAIRRSSDRLLSFVISERIRCYIKSGEIKSAYSELKRLRSFVNRNNKTNSPINSRVRGLLHYAEVLYYFAIQDDIAALELIKSDDNGMSFGPDINGLQLLKALLIKRNGDTEQAILSMYPVLLKSQSYGLVRMLLDFGEPMLDLAQECADQYKDQDPILTFYVEQLRGHAKKHSVVAMHKPLGLVDPLSEREQDVLNALSYSMSNKRIAKVLGLSPETVKWHLRNIYGKLGVAGRDDAVARARDMGLILNQVI